MTQPDLELTTEGVAVAWLKAIGTLAGNAVATTVPEAKSWPLIGSSRVFLQVLGTGGGTVGDTPYHRDVLSVDAWALKDASDRPPLGIATQLLTQVWVASFRTAPGLVTIGDLVARVDGMRPLNAHPRRVPDQDTSRAHYALDVEIAWTAEEG